jgi:hypothetical protein
MAQVKYKAWLRKVLFWLFVAAVVHAAHFLYRMRGKVLAFLMAGVTHKKWFREALFWLLVAISVLGLIYKMSAT